MMPERRLIAPARRDLRRGQVPIGNQLPVVAIHESAHAVIARVLGQPVLRVAPRLTTYQASPRSARDFYRAALVTLAGPAAEDRSGAPTCSTAMHHLDAAGGGMMAPVKREAERLVRENWDAIERVAEALIERGELSGDEVDALLARVKRARSLPPIVTHLLRP
jgi:hypothetical protein